MSERVEGLILGNEGGSVMSGERWEGGRTKVACDGCVSELGRVWRVILDG